MRILHTADLHLGRQFNGIALDDDHQSALDQIVAATIKHAPQVLLIAGDVFDRAAPPASAVRQFNAFLTRIARETDAAVVMIAGNHDSADRIGAMALMTDTRRALIRGPLMAEEPPLVLEDEHGPVAFSALPFAYEYAARECFGNETIASPEDVLAAEVAAARAALPQAARWIIAAHAFVTGGSASEGERPLTRVGGVETVRTGIFDGAHYVALGHLHRPQSLEAGRVRYSGAPLAFGFDEGGEEKSMSLINLDGDGQVSLTLVPFVPLRRVRTLRGQLADLLREPPSDDFIKAVLTDAAPQIDPMKRLRGIFPNACQLSYARHERAPELKGVSASTASLALPSQLIGDFLTHVRGETASEQETAIIAEALSALGNAEDAA